MSFFIEVLLPLSLPKTFTYRVSESEYDYIQKGMRIAVPFGKNKVYTALAVDKHRVAPTLYEAKEIAQILDEFPIVNEFQINHWFWMASYYMCAIGDVYRGALPSALLLESETVIVPNAQMQVTEAALSDEEFLIYEALQHQSALKLQTIIDILNKKHVFPVIQKLLDKKVITLQEEMHEEYKPKLVRYIRLSKEYQEESQLIALLEGFAKNANKQKEVILQLFQLQAQFRQPISVKQLTEAAQAGSAAIKALIEKQILEEYYIQEDRVSFESNKEDNELRLSDAQQQALSSIENAFEQKNITLLQGVTSSGKTEIYTRLIESYLEQGKQVLYLLPEIALTTQLVSRLTKHFGNKVAVFHSKYSNNERLEVWLSLIHI
jgi:primosomal protein N' (replication factor Y)